MRPRATQFTGTGPRHQNFRGGDPATELLREHSQITKDADVICDRLMSGAYAAGQDITGANLNYSLGGFDGPAKFVKDYATLFTAGAVGNIMATYLGSYAVNATVVSTPSARSAVVEYQVNNASTLASATHLPLYGIIPGYSKIEDFENSLTPTGPLSKTTQNFTWQEKFSW